MITTYPVDVYMSKTRLPSGDMYSLPMGARAVYIKYFDLTTHTLKDHFQHKT